MSAGNLATVIIMLLFAVLAVFVSALLYDDTHVDGRTDLMMSVNCTASLTGCA